MIFVRAGWFATDKAEVREMENTLGIKFVRRDENRDQLSGRTQFRWHVPGEF